LAFGIYQHSTPWLAASGAHLLVMVLLIGVLYRWTGNRFRNALVLPISLAMMLRIFFKALQLCATRKVEWRGTSYTHRMTRKEGAPL